MGTFFFWVGVAVVAGLLLNELLQHTITMAARGRLTQFRAGRRLRRTNDEVERRSNQFESLLKDVLDRARALGKTVPVERSGYEPVAVTFSDGATTYYFADFQTYQNGLRDGSFPPLRSFCGRRPPTPMSHRTEEELQQWLDRYRDEIP